MWRTFDRFLRRLPRPVVALLGLLTILAIGVLDFETPRELSLAVFNLVPVFVVAWYAGPLPATAAALLGGAAWFLDERFSPAVGTVSPLFDLGTKLVFFLAFAYLLARLRRSADRESALARRDALTGIANRLAFFERAGHELEAVRRRGEPVSVAFLDVDDFKAVNDRAGHDAGDEILVKIAAALSSELRAADVVARFGGDEFVALLPGADAPEARRALERVHGALSQLRDPSGKAVTVSAGVACFGSPPFHVDQLVQTADGLMYGAKSEGKGGLKVEAYGAVFVSRESQNQ